MLAVVVQTLLHTVLSLAYQHLPCAVALWLVEAVVAEVHAFCKLSRQRIITSTDAGTFICIVVRSML